MKKRLLATDLDGTFIPLPGDREALKALDEFKMLFHTSSAPDLVYVTGRDIRLINDAIERFELPEPLAVIADVGTSVYYRKEKAWVRDEEYDLVLRKLSREHSFSEIKEKLLALPGVSLQDPKRQGEFKLSFNIDEQQLGSVREILKGGAWKAVFSRDTFTGNGLLDILPPGVSKAYGVNWFLDSRTDEYERIVYAGDSGNDYDIFISGIDVILVANTPEDIKDRVSRVCPTSSVFMAHDTSTAGVREGCRHFGII